MRFLKGFFFEKNEKERASQSPQARERGGELRRAPMKYLFEKIEEEKVKGVWYGDPSEHDRGCVMLQRRPFEYFYLNM